MPMAHVVVLMVVMLDEWSLTPVVLFEFKLKIHEKICIYYWKQICLVITRCVRGTGLSARIIYKFHFDLGCKIEVICMNKSAFFKAVHIVSFCTWHYYLYSTEYN